jgi:hypothetical protein
MDKILASWAPEIGAGGVLCYLILKLVFQFLEKKNPPPVQASPVICPMAKAFDANQFKTVVEQSKDLWEWHNKEDPATGKKLWYSNSDSHLVTVLERSAAASEAQILVLTKLTAQVEHMTKGMERMEQDMKDLRS